MTPAEALASIQGLASAGRYLITRHARLRMKQRSADDRDVLRAIATAAVATLEAEGKWNLSGVDCTRDPLEVIAALDSGGVVIVTVY